MNLVQALLEAPEFGAWQIKLALPRIDYHGQSVEWPRGIKNQRLTTSFEGDASRANTPEELGAWIERAVADNAADVAYFPYPYHSICPELEIPILATFHDFNHKRFNTWNENMRANVERDLPRWVDRCVPIVSSRFIAAEMVSYYPGATGRVQVIPLGIPKSAGIQDETRWAAFSAEHSIPETYTLTVGWLAPHKNQAVLIEAFGALKDSGEIVAGLLVGPNSSMLDSRHDRYVRHLLHLADKWHLDYGRDIIGLGYVTADELDWLYAHASAVVMPTVYEAGSFPVREAMRLGCPVICSDIPPLVEDIERVGRDVALTFDPFDVGSLTATIKAVLHDPAAARERAARARDSVQQAFDWAATARGYAGLFETAVTAAPVAATA